MSFKGVKMKNKTIIKGTTPVIDILVEKIEDDTYKMFLSFGRVNHPYVTIPATSRSDEDDFSIFTFNMTQEDTFKLASGFVEMQMRGINIDEEAIATEWFKIEVLDSIQGGVISYDEEDNSEMLDS